MSKNVLFEKLTNHISFDVVLCADSKYYICIDKKAFLSREKDEIPEKPWFFRKPPVGSRNIYANCRDRGHIREHSGKV